MGLTITGKLSAENMDEFTKIITSALSSANNAFGNNILLNILFVGTLGLFIYWISKKV